MEGIRQSKDWLNLEVYVVTTSLVLILIGLLIYFYYLNLT